MYNRDFSNAESLLGDAEPNSAAKMVSALQKSVEEVTSSFEVQRVCSSGSMCKSSRSSYMVTCTHTHMLTCTHTHMLMHTFAHMHTYSHAHMHTCSHAHMLTCTHTHMLTCSHAHMHTCTHVLYTTTCDDYNRLVLLATNFQHSQ